MYETEKIRFCTTLLSSVNEFFSGSSVKLNHVLIGQLIEIYPSNDNFNNVLSYIGGLVNCKFVPLSKKYTIKSDELFLVYCQGEWSVVRSDEFKDDVQVFRVIHSKENERFSIGELLNTWSVNKSGIFHFFLYSVLLSFLALSIPLYMNAIYGRIIPSSAEASLWTLSTLITLLFVCEVYLKKKRERVIKRFMTDFSVFFEAGYIRKLVSFVASEGNQWGKTRNEAILNFTKLRALFWLFFSTNYIDSAFLFIYLFVIAIVGKWLVLATVFIVVIQVLIIMYYDRKLKLTNVESVNEVVSPPVYLLDNYKSRGMEDSYVNICSLLSAQGNLIQSIKLNNKISSSTVFTFLCSFQTVITVILAYYLLQDNDISSGSLFATIILSGKVNQSIGPLTSLLPLFRRIRSSFTQIESVLKTSTQHSDVVNNINDQQVIWDIEKLTFSYGPDVPLFSEISFRITHGEKVAIVGGEGVGKSTLLSLLLGVVSPSSGKVHRNIFKNGKDSLYYFPQKISAYADTLYTYLNSEGSIDDDKIKEVLSLPFLWWISAEFRSGIHSPVSEHFNTLRADRVQMLEMARALLSSSNIYVMDEPTAYVNSEIEGMFCNLLKNKLSDDDTLVFFTNRIKLLEQVDRIIVLENGKITFDGSRQDFLLKVKK